MEPVHVEMEPFSGEVDMNRAAILIIDMQVRDIIHFLLYLWKRACGQQILSL